MQFPNRLYKPQLAFVAAGFQGLCTKFKIISTGNSSAFVKLKEGALRSVAKIVFSDAWVHCRWKKTNASFVRLLECPGKLGHTMLVIKATTAKSFIIINIIAIERIQKSIFRKITKNQTRTMGLVCKKLLVLPNKQWLIINSRLLTQEDTSLLCSTVFEMRQTNGCGNNNSYENDERVIHIFF